MYSASHVESEMKDCFEDRQITDESFLFTLIRTPEIDFRSF